MFKKLFTAATVIFSMVSVAQAEVAYSMPALEVGFKLNTMDLDGATSNKQSQAFQGGGSIVFDFGDSGFGLKTGLMYSERTFKNEALLSNLEGKITYFDVPLHLMFKFEDYAGIFLGPSFSTKLGDECTTSFGGGCSVPGVKSTIMPLTFGAQFKMAANFGLSLFFETISGKVADNLESSRGVGANLLFVFD
ncbi:hypothetical protein [Pseudobdellovibrio sp. HCB154]|uniref:hypothetical protein n=1 Tax=Pseudobdellovibrio sp. HCB154 TaxID=3386277 RepID=UPI003916D0C3